MQCKSAPSAGIKMIRSWLWQCRLRLPFPGHTTGRRVAVTLIVPEEAHKL